MGLKYGDHVVGINGKSLLGKDDKKQEALFKNSIGNKTVNLRIHRRSCSKGCVCYKYDAFDMWTEDGEHAADLRMTSCTMRLYERINQLGVQVDTLQKDVDTIKQKLKSGNTLSNAEQIVPDLEV